MNLNAQPDSSTSLETAKQKPDTPAANHEANDSTVAASESVVSTVQIEEPITEHLTTTSVSDSRCAFSDCNWLIAITCVIFLFVGHYADVRETVSVEPRRVR